MEVETAIREVYVTWFAAMETGDVDRALSVVDPDVIHQTPDGVHRIGREALRVALMEFHAGYVERVSWTIDNLVVTGSEAEILIRETATIRPREGGASFRVTGRHAARLRRDGAGSWRVVQDIIRLEGEPVTVPHEFEIEGG